MAKSKSKKAKTKAKAKSARKAKSAVWAALPAGAVRLGLGIVVGLGIVGLVAFGFAAMAPERPTTAIPPAAAKVALSLPAQVSAQSQAQSIPDPVNEEEPDAPPPVQSPPAQPAPPPAVAPKVQLPPAPTGVLPWQKFAKPAPSESGPRVAIVIDDAGLDHHRTSRIVALPGPLTISFLTYGEGLAPQARAASAAGHELMVHVAMEAMSRSMDPGPDVLLRDIEPDEILARLTRRLATFDGYVGINNHMGSLFTADRAGMQIVLGELKRRGLLFLDSRTGPHTVGGEVARSLNLPHAERDVFLDNDLTTASVARQLLEVERIARMRGQAVAIGHPRDGTIEALARWIPDAKARGFVFVPISKIVRDNIARGALTAQSH